MKSLMTFGRIGKRHVIQFLILWFGFASAAAADIVLTEIMFDPAGSEYHDEYVELYNTSDAEPVDLAGWTLSDSSDTDGIIGRDQGTVLEPGQFALILDFSYFENSTFYDPLPPDALILTIDDGSFGKGGWSNSKPEPVILMDAQGDTAAFYHYTLGNTSGHSDEKIILEGGDAPENWSDSRVEGGTPGRPNSVSPLDYDVALKTDALQFAPLHPGPGEAVEIVVVVQNVGTRPAVNVQIALYRDADGDTLLSEDKDERLGEVAMETIPAGDSLEAVFVWNDIPSGVHALLASAAYTSDQRLSNNTAYTTLSVRFRSGDVVINEIMYAPSKGACEWLELFNQSQMPLDLYQWHIGGRVISSIPLLIPPKGYLVLAADSALCAAIYPDIQAPIVSPEGGWPSLSNEAGTVVLKDQTDAVIDSVSYQDDWARIAYASLERIHPSLDGNDAANWSSCVLEAKGTPGATNSVFVEELPERAALSVSPNPFEDHVIISYELPETTAMVNLWIYDREGRRVRKLLDAALSGSTRSKIWDGRNDDGVRLRMGIYIIYLEALNAREGVIYRVKKPVVLARKL